MNVLFHRCEVFPHHCLGGILVHINFLWTDYYTSLWLFLREWPHVIPLWGAMARWICEWAEERVWKARGHHTQFNAWFKGYIFSSEEEPKAQNVQLILEPEPTARLTGSIGCKKRYLEIVIGKSCSFASHPNGAP